MDGQTPPAAATNSTPDFKSRLQQLVTWLTDKQEKITKFW